ncbi:MAG: thermonuclease family protein [Proteobacteria bacterium]|nr:thermonuclease family protein [Pseudomonadota bacterium]
MLLEVAVCLVVGVSDGDTLTARCPTGQMEHPYQQVKVRLAEIDAPGSGQPFGQRSKRNLSELCFQVNVTITPTAHDRYGRTVARVECRGRDANLEQVKAGMAWAYTKYQTDAAFPPAERKARATRIGLWSMLGTAAPPIAPWEFRHLNRSSPPDATGCITGPKGGRYRLTPEGKKRYGC